MTEVGEDGKTAGYDLNMKCYQVIQMLHVIFI